MKKLTTNYSYNSPSVELIAFAGEQAVMTGSSQASGFDNEEFVPGGSYSDWN